MEIQPQHDKLPIFKDEGAKYQIGLHQFSTIS